ncbi:AAT family amino acid transporter [Aspergillus sclerotioniger CBS 115572]|uniref:AAT family amino acid transporter n=1 Tax=Aspergillus sclerotioniger CBS 115572 TaxID=1450535 RepID=A0A317WMJ0_9EURO|nr:AAT family amino acid transporter [Aspergillus sclerotioniger CBS 115572]PWY87285.1 AAT family amino acid transporter [Aspergillus sclerotioniger CBS 115572]
MDQQQIEPDAAKKVDSILEPQSDIPSDCNLGEIVQRPDDLQRHLTSRQIQFIAIGGSIGTALFVSIGYALMHGAASLLVAFILQACIMAQVNNSLAEMTIFMPVSAAFIQHASAWVDGAWGFMIGWNFCVFEGLLIPFEITALDMVLSFWRDDIPAAAVISTCIVLYAITNLFGVKYFGEAEFWLAGGKLLLITILFLFTFITMVGENPQHDTYGFRNWSKPSPFVEYTSTGDLGRFQGFLAALWQAGFTIVGPEYLACVAGEAQHPRKTLKSAFKSVYWRLGVFFIGGALCVGIILPANDPTLLRVLGDGDTGTGASSPYVIAMTNMGVEVLPDLVNALLFTSIYSAGNAYVYTTSRSLHGLAQNGHAPKLFRKCTKDGVPIYCLAVALAFACLSFLKLGSGSVQVLTWLTNLITCGTVVTYIVVCVNYIFFHRALKAQGFSRMELPYRGYFQPYGTWIALIWLLGIEVFYGYAVFLKGRWDIGSFFSDYTMAFLAIATYAGWKICKRTRFVRPQEADLVWARPAIDAHEAVMEEVHQAGIREQLMQTLRTKWGGGRSTSTWMV